MMIVIIIAILFSNLNGQEVLKRSDENMSLKRFNRDLNILAESSSINNIEKNSRVKFYIARQDSIENMKKIEFLKHPEDTLISGNLPVLIECQVKNSVQTHIECNSKIRDDAKKNISMINNVNYETLSLLIKRKDVDSTSKSMFNRKLVCKCVAYSEYNEKIISNKAVIKTAFLEDEFQSEPMDETSYEGKTVEMRCDPPRGEPSPVVYWLKDNQEIDTHSDSSRFKLSNDFSLLILASKKTDSGNYVCVASNLVDKRISKPAKLTLLDPALEYRWSEWSNWSECSSKCGLGVQKRTRMCQKLNNLGQLQNVSVSSCGNEASFENRKCELKSCEPKWSEWSTWTPCNTECKQSRRRYCENESVNTDYPESFSLDKPNSKSCTGEKIMQRNCCKEILNPKTQNLSKLPPVLTDNVKNIKLDSFDQTFLKLSIGLTASILLASLVVLIVVLAFLIKRGKNRKSNNNSELNLYYTCEKQFPIEDDCSIYKFSKTSNSTTGSSGGSSISRYKKQIKMQSKSDSNTPIIYCDSNRVFNNQNFESQLLLGNVSQHYQIVPNNNSSFVKSPIFLNGNSSSLSSNGSKNMTNTTVTSSLNNDYVHLNNELDDSNYVYNEFIISKVKSPLKNIQESSYVNLSEQSLQRLVHLQQIKNKQDEELAYDIADATVCYKNFLPINLDQTDTCIGNINSQGARLTLDCGICLLVPEDALSENSLMYLGVCRNEIYKPKLSEKNTFMSEIIQIGSQETNLKKPLVLTIDHCGHRIDNWDLKVYYSGNSIENPPDWVEDKDIFLNPTESSFVLITNKVGRFCITGEAYSGHEAYKYYRLICFYSSSITNNEFSLRIYCIDNLLVALQEVLRDEKKIGGHLLDSSEPFLLTNSNELIQICIDDLNRKYFNCKYNVNFQEIPLNHIWNGRNHLLHCSFLLEKLQDFDRLNCKIRAMKNGIDLLCSFSINYSLMNSNSNYDNLSNFCLKSWNHQINPNIDVINPKNLVKSYFKIDKNLKKQICTILDDSYKADKNWKALANRLNIKRNLNYFSCRTSPTELLLLYFEGISDFVKCYDSSIRLNNELINQNKSSIDRFSSPQELLFREIFLKYIL